MVVTVPRSQRLERSWTYSLTRLIRTWILSTTLLTGKSQAGRVFPVLTLLVLLRYTTTAFIFAQTNDTGEAVGAWVYNLTGSAL